LEQRAARYQRVVPARQALDLDAIARPEILDASGIERDHRGLVPVLF
jgi:hypothetical protein